MGATTAPAPVDVPLSPEKAEATWRAKAALRGIAVHRSEADDGRRIWIVTKWSLTRRCDSFDELVAMLTRMGVE